MSSFFPWGLQPSTSPVPINYDLVFNKTFPRVSFQATEQGSIYSEFIEVSGVIWTVVNATWDNNLLGWFQEGTCNPALPAYAWTLSDVTGSAVFVSAAAAGNATTPLAWVPNFSAGAATTTVQPLPLTITGQAALNVNATFNGTTGTVVSALEIMVNDLVSSTGSMLIDCLVNGNAVFQVDKTGKLVTGTVPSAQLSPPPYFTLNAGTGIGPITAPPTATLALAHGDYVDFATQQTITAQKTLSNFTPLQIGNTVAFLNGTFPNGDTFWSSGSLVQGVNPLVALAKDTKSVIVRLSEQNSTAVYFIYVDVGLTVNNTFNPTPVFTIGAQGNVNIVGNAAIGGNASVGGTFGVSGGTVLATTTINGDIFFGVPALKDLAATWFTPLNGMKLYYDAATNPTSVAFDGANFVLAPLTSHDGTVLITASGPQNQSMDLSIAKAGATGISQAVGTITTAAQINTPGGVTLALPNQLPGGSSASWFVTAMCHGFGLNTGGSIIMVGPSPGGQSTVTQPDYTRTLYTFAQMAGGSTPSARVSGSGVTDGHSGDVIALTILAIRTA